MSMSGAAKRKATRDAALALKIAQDAAAVQAPVVETPVVAKAPPKTNNAKKPPVVKAPAANNSPATKVTNVPAPTLDSMKQPPIVTNALNAIYRNIDAILGDLKPLAKTNKVLRMQYETALRNHVHTWITTVKALVMANAAGEPNGFRGDNTGILNAQTDYSKAAIIAKYPDAGLVDKFAAEILAAEEAEEAKDTSSPVSTTEIAKVISSNDNIVPMKLKDKSVLELNKKTGDIAAVNPETGEKTWFRGIMDTTKEWGMRFYNWLKTFFVNVYEFFMGFFRKAETAQANIIEHQTAA